MKVQKVLRRLGGVVIGICGFCTMVTVDSALKNVEMPEKCKWMRGVARYTAVYTLYGLFMLLAYKLLDKPFNYKPATSSETAETFGSTDAEEIFDDEDEDL